MTRAIRSELPEKCADLENEMVQDTESLVDSDFEIDVEDNMEVS